MEENVLGNVVGSLINRNRDEWGGGCGGFGIWMVIFLFLVMGGGFGWNNRANAATTQDVAVNGMYNQIDGSLRSIERGQSTVGYNMLDQFGRTNMLVQGSANNLQQAINEGIFTSKDCCCTTNRNIDAAKYELTNGINNNRYELTRNVDALRYDTAQQTCAITTHDTANTQKILDKLCAMEASAKDTEIARLRSDLQAAQLTLAQGVQTQTIVSALTPPAAKPAYIVPSPYCNCNNAFAYNYGGTTIA